MSDSEGSPNVQVAEESRLFQNKNQHTEIAAKELALIKEPLKKEDIGDPAAMVVERLLENGGTGLIALGEASHHGEGTLIYEKQFIEEVNAQIPVKKVFLEEDEKMMPLVTEYYETGKMPHDLEVYLKRDFVRGDAPHSHKYNLVVKCRELGIPVQFIDDNKHPDRDSDWNQKIGSEIGSDMNGLYVMISGVSHAIHSEMLAKQNRPTAVHMLDAKYPGKIVSMRVQTGYPHDHPTDEEYILENRFLKELKDMGMDKKPAAIKLKGSPYEGRRLYTTNRLIGSDAFDLMVNVPGARLATRVDKPSLKFQVKAKLESLIEGKFYSDHFHKEPIPVEVYSQLADVNSRYPVTAKEKALMNEFLRSEIYRQRKDEIDTQEINPRVLYLASGDDAIPAKMFGYGNVLMTSLEKKYYSAYNQWAHELEVTDKTVSAVQANPFENETFSTVVVNGIPVFEEEGLRNARPGDTDRVLQEMRRVTKTGGVAIVTNYGMGETYPSSTLISYERRKALAEMGWQIEEENYRDQLPYCRLKAIEAAK